MHIVDFFRAIEQRPPSQDKGALLDSLEEKSSPAITALRNTFPADDAYDLYFSGLMASSLMSAKQVNYPLALLINFGVHQLTMRRFDDVGSQIFTQIGCLDGHEFICGLLKNVHITSHLVTNGDEASAYGAMLNNITGAWSAKPELFKSEHMEYFKAHNPSIGLLALVNQKTPDTCLEVLSTAWPYLHQHCDIIIQGSTAAQEKIITSLDSAYPHLHFFSRRSPWYDGASMTDQIITVFQKTPLDYRSIIPELP